MAMRIANSAPYGAGAKASLKDFPKAGLLQHLDSNYALRDNPLARVLFFEGKFYSERWARRGVPPA
jgi:hypothetical protein